MKEVPTRADSAARLFLHEKFETDGALDVAKALARHVTVGVHGQSRSYRLPLKEYVRLG